MTAFSDYILEGAKLRPQVHHTFFDETRDETGKKVLGSCAVGAAIEAAIPGVINRADELKWYIGSDDKMRELLETTGMLDEIQHPCLSGEFNCRTRSYIVDLHEGMFTYHEIVVHLNDKHSMSRENIAAWLKSKGR